MKILGIDLGTSNTYLYAASLENKDPSADLPRPLILEPVSDATGSIATVVLYESDKPVAIGNAADLEFHNFPSDNRFLAAQFKPEISGNNPEAQRYMTDFLAILAQTLPKDFLKGEIGIYVGIPSLAREDFAINLAGCFVKAGWPRPEIVRESDAALVSCLQNGALTIADMQSKCLILDFGGGTCDYTAVEGLDVFQNGGDILYGGRLFDDLVFNHLRETNKDFAQQILSSPSAWFAHWVECREQKEEFSNFINATLEKKDEPGWETSEFMLRVSLVTGNGISNFFAPFSFREFMLAAEGFTASPELQALLIPYANRGGLGTDAADLLAGRNVGLITWLRNILKDIDKKASFRKIILTGGSSRWFFVRDLCARLFPNATCVASRRGYEDIAFGLALFPSLMKSRETVSALLEKRLPEFTRQAMSLADGLIGENTRKIASLCAQRIVERDILPALENASSLTVEQLEEKFRENISSDTTLLEIVQAKSAALNRQIQEKLGSSFRLWLKENGVLLTPVVQFPTQDIEDDFFRLISSKLAELDIVRLTRLAFIALVPLIVGTTAAHFLAPLGEPISIATGVGFAGGTAWLAAKTAHKLLAKRKIPAFLLGEKNRGRIIEKNRSYLEKELLAQFGSIQAEMTGDVERRLKASLQEMVSGLSILNQIETR